MKIFDNKIIPENGNCLKIKPTGEIVDSVYLGNYVIEQNGVKIRIEVSPNDVIEVYPLYIDNDLVFVENKSYDKLVSELIRLKYSIDDEIALHSNSLIKDNSKQLEDYQNWRKKCKEIAKDYLNE